MLTIMADNFADNADGVTMRVVLVYLQPFRRNSLLKCALQPKIAKNSTKPLFGEFNVVQGHQC